VRKDIFRHRLWRPREARQDVNRLSLGSQNVQSLTKKTVAVRDLVEDRDLDIVILTETWHHTSDDISLQLATPNGYIVHDAARSTDPGHGGIAVLHRRRFRVKRIALPELITFECLCLRLSADGTYFILLSVYRPGSARATALFFDELTTVLESLVVQSCSVIIGGDFSIHIEDQSDHDTARLVELIKSFDLTQHVTQATHRYGGTLDFIITSSNCPVLGVTIDPPYVISDHALVSCQLPSAKRHCPVITRAVRSWRRVDRHVLREAIENSDLVRPPADGNVDELFQLYDSVLRQVADRLAPTHSVHCRIKPMSPWFDAECRAIRRHCRWLEKRYQRSRNLDDRDAWVQAVRRKNEDFRATKNRYWSERLQSERQTPTKLWRSPNKIMCNDRAADGITSSLPLTSDGLLQFIEDKVKAVRKNMEDCPSPVMSSLTTVTLSCLQECSSDVVHRVIQASPAKSCALDPIPTFLLRAMIDVLLPFITAMVNASLREGRLPQSQKHAVISPMVKKPGLDPAEMNNNRPVSNLTFISKVVERVVCEQLVCFLTENDLMPQLQSAYRWHHSTETALVRVVSDLLGSVDDQHVTLLGLLDLSAAFDCVDHDILDIDSDIHSDCLQWHCHGSSHSCEIGCNRSVMKVSCHPPTVYRLECLKVRSWDLLCICCTQQNCLRSLPTVD
jgi:exonuclease III